MRIGTYVDGPAKYPEHGHANGIARANGQIKREITNLK